VAKSTERCPECGRPVRSLQIDDTEEMVRVSGKSIHVAILIPGLAGYTTTYALRVHRCPRSQTLNRTARAKEGK
jgi:hypothetical protein